MSERMIELQREKLGILTGGSSPAVLNSSQTPKASPHAQKQSPGEAATASLLTEDAQIERFINRLQRRDDSQPFLRGNTSSTSGGMSSIGYQGPTVPTALSRRMLQRQGIGYLDNTVATVVSASADRFLATVLQQAVACRDQRLNGAAMAREAAKHRKRHMQHYEADTDDRKRRKGLIEQARESVALSTIAKAEQGRKPSAASPAATGQGAANKKTTKSKKNKKAAADETNLINGARLDPAIRKLAEEEEEDNYDSIDEEEEYYQERIGETGWGHGDIGDDDEEEEDDTLILKDIVRPLEAWNFHLTGKEILDSDGEQSDDEEEEDDIDEAEGTKAESSVAPSEEDGNDDDTMMTNGTSGKDDDADNDSKKSGSTGVTGEASTS